MRKSIYVATAAILATLAGCEKYALDRQMEELCKKDAGLEVFETVTLPRSAFDPTGRVIRKYVNDASKPLASYAIVSGGEYSINSATINIVGGEVGTGFVKKGRLWDSLEITDTFLNAERARGVRNGKYSKKVWSRVQARSGQASNAARQRSCHGCTRPERARKRAAALGQGVRLRGIRQSD